MSSWLLALLLLGIFALALFFLAAGPPGELND